MSVKRSVTRAHKIWILLGSLGLCVLLNGAFIAYRQYAYRTEDLPWYRPSSEAPDEAQWQELDPARIHRVVKGKQREAQERLEDAAAIELTKQQAAELAGGPLPDVPGTKPYLVRSLVKFLPGVYWVGVWEDHVFISHRSLGSGFALMRRQALVLQLDREPAEVYTEATSAR